MESPPQSSTASVVTQNGAGESTATAWFQFSQQVSRETWLTSLMSIISQLTFSKVKPEGRQDDPSEFAPWDPLG